MLSEYRRYLTGIRDSFIQNGVELEVKNIEDYSDVFYLGEKLSLLSWYFSVLAIGGSPDSLHGFIFPLNSFYMGKVRDKYFEDYLLFKAGYMQISKSETLKRLNIVEPTNKVVSEAKVSESKPEDIVEEVKEKFEVADIPVVDEDGFIIYTTNGIIDNIVEDSSIKVEEVEDSTWGSYQEDEDIEEDSYEEDDYEDDIFSSWGSSDEEDDDDDFVAQGYVESDEYTEDDDFISQEYEEEDDDFVTQEYELSEYDEDTLFGTWGDSDEELEDIIEDGEDEDTLFGTWGDSDEDMIDGSSEDNSFDEDEELFKEWGSDSEEDEFEEEYVEEDSSVEDLFSSWGDSEDEELEQEYEDSSDDEEFFGSWGGSDDEDSEDIGSDDSYEEDIFGNWGSSDEEEDIPIKRPSKFDENRGSGFSSYGGVGEAVNNGMINVTPKSKEDYLIESNEEVLQNIEKLTGFMSKGLSKGGSLLKSKVTEIFKNSDDL